jgi:uncharacterized protein YndB with AHSA1/START domain
MLQELHTLTIVTRGNREIQITRTFDAPRRAVFAALTRPEFLRRWMYGPDDWALHSSEIDLRPGGGFRLVWKHLAGKAQVAMCGTCLEVQTPTRVVATEAYEQPWYFEGEAITTLELADEGEQTLLTVRTRYPSRAARDLVMESPLALGLSASYDRLEMLLEVL